MPTVPRLAPGESAMSFTIDTDRNSNLIRVVAAGDHGVAEALAMLDAAAAELRSVGAAGVVVDVRGSPYAPSLDEVQLVAGRVGGLFRGVPFAVVAARGLHTGIAGQLAAFARIYGGQVETFDSPAAAAAWVLATRSSGLYAPAL